VPQLVGLIEIDASPSRSAVRTPRDETLSELFGRLRRPDVLGNGGVTGSPFKAVTLAADLDRLAADLHQQWLVLHARVRAAARLRVVA
jgi:hypothetical protein